jgi:hypothetical protein
MAVIYFTNNADAGTGSLRAAIASAQPGDVVRPDETVFERGSAIEIVLASTLSVGKNLTLDGGPFRVHLNGGGAIRCASVAANVTATFIGVDFVAGYNNGVGGGINAPGTTDVTFERCGFYGCNGTFGGGSYTTGTTRYNDCAFLGCAATESGGAVYASKETTLNGVTAAGCVAANKGDSLCIVNGTATAVNAILCGSVGNPQFLTATGSVVGVASSSVGFVASPPDDLSVENWDANAWQNWDLRLLDDASPNPSIYRDSGAVDKISRHDIDGNFRGRETNGATSCSPGANETLQADLFWIGVEIDPTAPSDLKVADYDAEAKTLILSWTPNLADATGYDVQYSTSGTGWANLTGAAADATSRLCGGLGAAITYIYRIRAYNAVGATAWSTIAFTPSALDEATTETGTREVVSPSLLASNGWAASRFARRPGDVAPQSGKSVFVDGSVAFSGAPSGRLAALTLGGGSVLNLASGDFKPLKLEVGVGGALLGVALSGWEARLGDFANVKSKSLNTYNLNAVGENVYIQAYVAYGVPVSNAPTYGVLRLAPTDSLAPTLSGRYVCETFQARPQGDGNALPTAVNGDALVVATNISVGDATSASTCERLFSAPVAFRLQGVATATVADGAAESWANDFEIDVTDATSATLTLDGQTVYGDAPNAAVKLTGSAKIDERGLDVASLALNADATLELKDGARLKVGSVAAAEDSSFLADFSNVEASEVNLSGAEFALTGGTVCALGTLVATSGSTFVCAASDVSIASASIADSALDVADGILSFSGTSTFNDATASGDGYVVVPYETDLTELDFDETETRVCFRGANVEKFAAVSNGRETTFRWTAENPDVPVVVEVRNGDDWDVVELHARGPAFSVASGPSGEAEFRAFDGDKFLTTSIYVPAFHAWLTYDNLFTSAIVVKSYKVVTEFILMSIYFNANEAPVFLARIEDSATSIPVAPEQIESIGLTAYALRLSRGVKKRVPLDGWVDVEVPTTAIQSELIASDPRWKQDSIGYNFLFEPDLRGKQLFAQAGEYVVVISVKFKDGNPAPLVFEVAVK